MATQNPPGSSDPRDLVVNAGNLDVLVTSTEALSQDDRLGVARKTWHGMEVEFDAAQIQRAGEFDSAQADRSDRFDTFMDGSAYFGTGPNGEYQTYAAGITFTERNQVIYEAGEAWKPASETALPYVTTGAGMPESGAFVAVGDAVLRQELADPAQGAAKIARGAITVESIADLLALPAGQHKADATYLVKSYHADDRRGGGEFEWLASGDAAQHDGGFFIAPAKAFPTDWNDEAQRTDWFTAPSGVGVFRRSGKNMPVNAEIYGVKADYNISTGAGTDDADSINKALSKNSVVVLPGRWMRVTKSINLSYKFGGAVLQGTGGSFIGGAFIGTVVAGDTGAYPVIDRSGSQIVKLLDMVLIPGLTAPASVGVLDQRATDSQYAQFNVLERMTIDMKSSPAANNGAGTIGVCNVAAEIGTVRDCYIKGDTGYYFGSTPAPYNVPSLYATQGGPSSCSTLYFEGSTVLHSYDPVGAPLVMSGAAFVQGDVYVASSGGTGSHGFRLKGLHRGLSLRVFVEFAESLGLISGLEGCNIECLGNFNANKNLKTDGSFTGITNTDIRFTPTISGSFTPPDYWIQGTSTDVLRNVKITAPAAPAVRFVVPTNEEFNLLNCSFEAVNTSLITRQSFKTRTSAFSDRPLRIGNHDIWVDANGMLRRKSGGAPANASDGFPISEKVTVPTSATAAGKPGQWAASITYFYAYVGDGITHSWVRAALASW